MKKIISLLLALLMTFSVVTVAFANGEETTTVPETTVADGENAGDEETTEDPVDLGEYQWILDLPFWTVGPALKFAKIAFKLVSAYLKVAKIFGLVEQDMGDMILGAILDLIENSQNAENGETTTVAPETTTAAAAA